MMDYSVLVGTLSEWGMAGRYRGMAGSDRSQERHWIFLLEMFGLTLWTSSHQLTPSTNLSVVFCFTYKVSHLYFPCVFPSFSLNL